MQIHRVFGNEINLICSEIGTFGIVGFGEADYYFVCLSKLSKLSTI
jgi:hypothetical protein